MKPHLPFAPRALFALLLTSLLACGGGPPKRSAGAAQAGAEPHASGPQAAGPNSPGAAARPVALPPPAPWTDSFQEAGTLVATAIRIEGPPGLRDHLALTRDDVNFKHATEATDQGLVQVVETVAGDVCRGQLDRWQLAAMRSIEVLERPGGDTVRVTAVGEAVWLGVDGQEQRDDQLIFEVVLDPPTAE